MSFSCILRFFANFIYVYKACRSFLLCPFRRESQFSSGMWLMIGWSYSRELPYTHVHMGCTSQTHHVDIYSTKCVACRGILHTPNQDANW